MAFANKRNSSVGTGVPTSSGSGLTQTGGSSISTTTSQPTNTFTVPTNSVSATTSSIKCHHNNCYRQMVKSLSRVSPFCATYTQAVNTATTGLPTFVSNCGGSPTKISSACSCLVAPATSTSSQASTSSSGAVSASSSSSEIDITLTSRSTRTLTTTQASLSTGPTSTGTGVSSGIIPTSSGPVLFPNSTSLIATSSDSGLTQTSPSSNSILTSVSGSIPSSSYYDTTSVPYPAGNSTTSSGSTGTGGTYL